MENRNSRIKTALNDAGVTQEKLAEKLGISRAAVSERLNKEDEIDSIAFLEAVTLLTGVSEEWIRTGQKKKKSELEGTFTKVNDAMAEYFSGKKVRPITVTVDSAGKENMVMVPVRAFAGYMKGYGDPEFIGSLSAFNLPNFSDGTYRMFQVDGNSMLQLGGGGLHDGDFVIGKYLEDIFTIRDNRVYVVVSTEGVAVKRCFNRLLTDEKVLILNSDNKGGSFPAIVLHPHEILEVWELKAYISRQLTFHTDLWDTLSRLESSVAIMQNKVKELEKGK